MSKLFRLLPFLLLFIALSLISPSKVLADGKCTWEGFTDENGNRLPPWYRTIKKVNFVLNVQDRKPEDTYTIQSCGNKGTCFNLANLILENLKPDQDGIIKNTITLSFIGDRALDDIIKVYQTNSVQQEPYCTFIYPWFDAPSPTPVQRAECTLNLIPNKGIDEKTQLTIAGRLVNINDLGNNYSIRGLLEGVHIQGVGFDRWFPLKVDPIDRDQFFSDIQKGYKKGEYTATAYVHILLDFFALPPRKSTLNISCDLRFSVPGGVLPTPSPIPTPTIPPYCSSDPKCSIDCGNDFSDPCYICPQCPGYNKQKPRAELKPLCEQIGQGYKGSPCRNCIDPPASGIWTAIGCVPTNVPDILKEYVFKWGIGIAGGVAFLYFLYGAFLILTSMGNAEKINEGKEIITSSIAGILLIIFSVLILKIAAVDILKIPGFI